MTSAPWYNKQQTAQLMFNDKYWLCWQSWSDLAWKAWYFTGLRCLYFWTRSRVVVERAAFQRSGWKRYLNSKNLLLISAFLCHSSSPLTSCLRSSKNWPARVQIELIDFFEKRSGLTSVLLRLGSGWTALSERLKKRTLMLPGRRLLLAHSSRERRYEHEKDEHETMPRIIPERYTHFVFINRQEGVIPACEPGSTSIILHFHGLSME